MAAVPSRFDVRAPDFKDRALLALKRDGAVILTHVKEEGDEEESSSWESCAAKVPHLLWETDQLLLSQHKAAGIHEDNGPFELQGQRLHPHTDGYIWGDAFPDIVILCCEREGAGGESFVVDGHVVVERLESATKKLLSEAIVNHTECQEVGGIANGIESFAPVLRWQDTERLWLQPNNADCSDENVDQPQRLVWRRQLQRDYVYGKRSPAESFYNSIWNSTDPNVKAALHRLDSTIMQVEKESATFQLTTGEALIVDNFRMLHGRTSYSMKDTDKQRRMWRVWAWTSASFGLPDAMKGGVTATVRESEELLANSQ